MLSLSRSKPPRLPRYFSLLVLLAVLLAAGCTGGEEGAAAGENEEVSVQEVEGAVEWSNGNDDWSAVEDAQALRAGDRLRTDDGTVWITFAGGSRAFVAPQSELLIEAAGAGDAEGQPAIRLRQERGDSRHVVNGLQAEAQVESDLDYVVVTPAGETGTSQGTYTVSVARDSAEPQTRVAVSSGLVKASSGGETYPVAAGRVLMLRANQAPELASFPVFGRGLVSQSGDTWVIGGRQFVTTAATLIRGDVSIGQQAYVQGHVNEDGVLVADLIAAEGIASELMVADGEAEPLLQAQGSDDEVGCFAASGVVVQREGDVVTLHDGRTVDLAGAASVDGDVQLHSTVLVVTCSGDDGAQRYDVYVLEEPDEDGEDEDGKTVICHIPPGNAAAAHTLAVDDAALGAHLGHGDYVGFCEGDTDVVDDDFDDDEDELDDDGELDNGEGGKVTLCHVPPGNPAAAHTITVGRPALEAHLGHGDYQGACDGDGNNGGKGNGKGNGKGRGRGANGKP